MSSKPLDLVEALIMTRNRFRTPETYVHWLNKAEWDWLWVELAKRESPMHKYCGVREDGTLWMCGTEVRVIRSIPKESEDLAGGI